MPIGTVKFFNDTKGFGFIQPDDGSADSFVHISDVEKSGMRGLAANQKVNFEIEIDQRGKSRAVGLSEVA